MRCTRRHFVRQAAGALALPLVGAGRVLASPQEAFAQFGLVPIARIAPRPSISIGASPLSVGYETLDRKLFDPSRTFAHAAQLGVKWARCQTGWARTERTPGQYDFGWLDEVVDGLRRIGIQPWFNLGYGNPLYTLGADETAVGYAPVFDDHALEAWKRFTAAIAEHFRGRVRHYEIWNEPNITAFWKPGKPDARLYVRLVAHTAPILRQRVPNAILIGGALAGVPLGYLKECLAAGLAKHVDVLSYHPYREIPEKNYEADVQAMRRLLAQHGASLRLWQGECGCPSKKGGAGALAQGDWNETRQAKWLLRRILSDLRLGVELTSYFLIVDLVGYRGSTNWKGLLRGLDYSPKPAYFAYQHLCALFDAETRNADIPIRVEGPEAGEAMTVAFLRRGKPLYGYWTPADLTRQTPLRQVRVSLGQALDRPVLLDLLSGQIYRLPGLDRLPLADYPLLIASERTLA